MRRLLLQLSPALHLTRVTTAFAAVANVWFVILWTAASPQENGLAPPGVPLWAQLLGGAINALGLFAYATALNDVLDHRRDAALNPERPIPAGQIAIDRAITLVVCTLGAAVLGATILGMPAVLLTLLVAGAILFFNAAGRFVPAVGLVVLGLIYAGQMVVPNLALRFVWPVWLVMTHTLLVGTAKHLLSRRAPGISQRAAVFAVSGWAFWTAVMLYASWRRNAGEGGLWPEWVRPGAAVWPLLLAVLYAGLCWRRVHALGRTPRAAEKVARYGSLWLALYACAWLFGQGYAYEGSILAALSAAGFLGMTVLREIYALIEHPMGYRR